MNGRKEKGQQGCIGTRTDTGRPLLG